MKKGFKYRRRLPNNTPEHGRTSMVDIEYSLLTSKWQWPSLGITIPAILLSIPKCESASLTNTNKRIDSFLHPILSCQVMHADTDVVNNRAELKWMAATCTPLTPQTAACTMASKPHSGRSMFADTRCLAIIWLNLSVSLVSDSTCLYPNVGRQVTSGEMPLRETEHRSRSHLNVTSAVVTLYTCRGWPALLLWSWWTAGWVSPQTSRSPGEIYLWGSSFPSKERTPNLWSSADRQTWTQTGPSGSRGPRGSPLCAAPSPGKSLDCLRQTQNQQLIFTGKTGGQTAIRSKIRSVPGRIFRAIFWGEIWVLLRVSIFFPNGRSWRTSALETGNSR